MKKTIQVDLQFNANVANAKSQMQQLQTQLSGLATQSSSTQLSITPQLREAQNSAMQLKIALNNAFNQNTGKLNLNKFRNELKQSGLTLSSLSQKLQMLGPEGTKAFQQMTSQIMAADTKMISLSGKMKSLMDTFGSAIKWNIAYSAINMVTQGIGDAVRYAKELDSSLNNIRIVTGKSAQDMAAFAKEANKMAKTLSTTTTKYTDASLIYYQQGLNDQEVQERTDITVKMANVAGQSAETVSDQLTAVWNNFDDGTKSLEHYADVMTALGAATASSTDEIADGLEKFAAVADTVGLSYEYAASALATVTATTRQSADVVGTAFKTLFARIEGLELGETLDDGTTLNKYSEALMAVGVNIKDSNGEMKEITVLRQEDMFGHPIQNSYIVDYNGVICTAIFNPITSQYYADDKYGIIHE